MTMKTCGPRICVVGAGAIGGVLACLMSRAGYETSVIARGAHLHAIRDGGLQLVSSAGLDAFTAHPTATDDPSELGGQDVVFLCVKAHDLPGMAGRIRSLIGPQTMVVPVLNGIPWWYFHGLPDSPRNAPIICLDPQGEAAAHIPAALVVGCVVRIAATVDQPGVVRHTFGNRFILGEPSNALTPRLQELCDLIQRAGLDAHPTIQIRNEIWAKVVGNLSTNPLSALTLGTINDLCESPGLVALMRQMMAECHAVGTAYGIDFDTGIEENLVRFRRLGDARPSMLQDIERGRPMELAAILQSVSELGQRVQVNTPALDIVLALISERARHL